MPVCPANKPSSKCTDVEFVFSSDYEEGESALCRWTALTQNGFFSWHRPYVAVARRIEPLGMTRPALRARTEMHYCIASRHPTGIRDHQRRSTSREDKASSRRRMSHPLAEVMQFRLQRVALRRGQLIARCSVVGQHRQQRQQRQCLRVALAIGFCHRCWSTPGFRHAPQCRVRLGAIHLAAIDDQPRTCEKRIADIREVACRVAVSSPRTWRNPAAHPSRDGLRSARATCRFARQ